MKKYAFFAVAAAALFLTACPNLLSNKEKDKGQASNTPAAPSGGVSFDNFTTRSVSVKNNTGERLVAFKGEISPSSLISGVPAHASNHGLRMDESLFSATGDFALLFLTEKTYNEHKDNLAAVRNSPFTSIYAFYNKSGSNDLVYTISSKSGGNAKLTLQNNSAFNVEIRVNSPEGEVLGYVGAYTANTVLNVNPGDYTLYPVFKKYIARDNEIYSVVPKFKKSKKPYAQDFAITDADSWNVGSLWDATALQLSSGGFYLTINNQSKTAVRFKKGTEEFETSLGIKGIKSGAQATFFIPFNKEADGSYPDSFKMSTLTIGSALYPNDLPEHTYKLDTKYTITVTGNEQDDLQFSALEDKGTVDINKLFGL
ncbi:MAG: hypothetical protein P1P65_02200 [Treponema sp.]